MFDRKQINTKTAFKSYIDKIPNSNPLGVWIYSEEFYSLPEYGYKIHVSCDGNNYHSILEICLPYLIENCISFKIISSYSHMVSLNRGEYGYTQIGKVITVYPKDFLAFKKIVFDLYLMTKYIRSVAIPSDFNIFDSEVIYYRFGELNGEEDRTNKEVSDNRIRYIDESCEYLLPWHNIKRYSFIPDFLYPIKNIHSNGKSKLFKAYDSRYKKFCFLKIGIFLGNIEKNNVDSFDRVAWESYVLKNLTNEKFLPDYLDSFIVGNDFFLLEEFIDGKSLGESLIDNSINGREIDISIEIFHIVKKLHSLGYRLIDLSLNNFMFDLEQIYIVDLEYIYNKNSEYFFIDNYNQGTIGFFFPELKLSPLLFDIYALYKLLFFIFNRFEYIEFINCMNKHNLDVYTDDFINKKEASFMEKLSEFFCFNLYMNMNELSYDEHLIFIEKFLLNLKGESSNENQC